jgi:hypothetical protein
MLAALDATILFGANKVSSTKGPHWRIRQFAGFKLSAMPFYTLKLVLQNLSSSWNEVTISHGANIEEPTIATTFQIPPGEFKMVTIPACRDGRSLLVKCNYEVALRSIGGMQISSAWQEAPNSRVRVLPSPGFNIKAMPASWAGDALPGSTCDLLFKPSKDADDWCFLVELSCNGTISMCTLDSRTRMSGYCYLVVDSTTPQFMQLVAQSRTNFSLNYKEFADYRGDWQAPSGMAVWNV